MQDHTLRQPLRLWERVIRYSFCALLPWLCCFQRMSSCALVPFLQAAYDEILMVTCSWAQ